MLHVQWQNYEKCKNDERDIGQRAQQLETGVLHVVYFTGYLQVEEKYGAI